MKNICSFVLRNVKHNYKPFFNASVIKLQNQFLQISHLQQKGIHTNISLYDLSHITQSGTEEGGDKSEVLDGKKELVRDEEHKDLSKENEKKMKVLKLEYEVLQCTGVRVPDTMQEKHWTYLLERCHSIHARKNYYSFLFKNERASINERKKTDANIKRQNEKKLEITKLIEEGKLDNFKNTFLMFVQDRSMSQFYYNNLFRAMTNGPHLVFDFSFEENMKFKEFKNLIKQIYVSYGANKTQQDPFHFHFCHLPSSSESHQEFLKLSPNIDSLPITISSDSYLNHYPKQNLIYLTPDASEVMTDYEEDATYIIGGIVDKAEELPLTMAKARREGIRMVKLPLDHYVKWTQGSKALSLNQVVEILLSIRKTRDWTTTLQQCLPKRKYLSLDDDVRQVEEERRKKKMKRWSIFAEGGGGGRRYGENDGRRYGEDDGGGGRRFGEDDGGGRGYGEDDGGGRRFDEGRRGYDESGGGRSYGESGSGRRYGEGFRSSGKSSYSNRDRVGNRSLENYDNEGVSYGGFKKKDGSNVDYSYDNKDVNRYAKNDGQNKNRFNKNKRLKNNNSFKKPNNFEF